MGKHIVNLTDAEVRRLPGTLLVVRPFTKANMRYPNGAQEIACAVYPARESGYVPWYGKDRPGLAELTKQEYKDGFLNPLGAPGDVLVGKEAWRVGAWNHEKRAIAVDYRADGFVRREWLPVENDALFERLWAESTDDAIAAGLVCDAYDEYRWEPGQGPTRWRPASTMPRWAIRWKRRVVNSGVMRVRDLADPDIKATGVAPTRLYGDMMRAEHGGSEYACAYHEEFARRWRKVRYEDNPWLWWAMVEEWRDERPGNPGA
jgi:hypothetical protein